jgi:hypothetical protein
MGDTSRDFANSASCQKQPLAHMQRKSGLAGRVAAWPKVDEWPVWAVTAVNCQDGPNVYYGIISGADFFRVLGMLQVRGAQAHLF